MKSTIPTFCLNPGNKGEGETKEIFLSKAFSQPAFSSSLAFLLLSDRRISSLSKLFRKRSFSNWIEFQAVKVLRPPLFYS